MTKLFIGLPVYNGEAYLADAIESVLAQSFQDFTLFISDNASTDTTAEIARRYATADPRVVYHRHETNMGAAPNFNFCVEQAQGDYFKWMAHDDLLAPDYIRACVNLLERDQGVVLCHAGVISIDEAGQRTGHYDLERNFDDPDPVARFTRAMALDHACVTVFGVMRLSVLKQTPKIGPFVGSDRSLLVEFALQGRMEYVPERFFFWREHKNRSVRLKRSERVAWFDANAKSIVATLYVRQIFAAQAAALRAPQSGVIKLRLLWKTIVWAARYRARLFQDMRAVVRIMLGSLAKRRPDSA